MHFSTMTLHFISAYLFGIEPFLTQINDCYVPFLPSPTAHVGTEVARARALSPEFFFGAMKEVDLDLWEPPPAPLSSIGLDQPLPQEIGDPGGFQVSEPPPPSLRGSEADPLLSSLVEARTEPGAAVQVQELQVVAQQSSVQVGLEANGVQVSVQCSSAEYYFFQFKVEIVVLGAVCLEVLYRLSLEMSELLYMLI
jgi:hypothetical protein